eukprot:3683317-Prymnesium_polylepis.1
MPGVHNSRWVQSPAASLLASEDRHDELKGYIGGVVAHFRGDPRVMGWDLYNEPDNPNLHSYGRLGVLKTESEPEHKVRMASRLVDKVFAWARAASPSQPLTVGAWSPPSFKRSEDAKLHRRMRRLEARMLNLSDVISFHNYGDQNALLARIGALRQLGRPLLCTEYMARPRVSVAHRQAPMPSPARAEVLASRHRRACAGLNVQSAARPDGQRRRHCLQLGPRRGAPPPIPRFASVCLEPAPWGACW